jgi:hypothetical protein
MLVGCDGLCVKCVKCVRCGICGRGRGFDSNQFNSTVIFLFSSFHLFIFWSFVFHLSSCPRSSCHPVILSSCHLIILSYLNISYFLFLISFYIFHIWIFHISYCILHIVYSILHISINATCMNNMYSVMEMFHRTEGYQANQRFFERDKFW